MSQNLNDLYYTRAIEKPYGDVLTEIKHFCIKEHAETLTNNTDSDMHDRLCKIIERYLMDNHIAVGTMERDALVLRLYNDMAGYSFLKDWIYKPGVEEVNINAWNDIEVVMSGGRGEKISDKFESPQHAVDVVRRMLASCNITIDDTMPCVLGYLDKNIRIEVDKAPVVDEDVGVSASIRIVNTAGISRDKLIASGSATPEMLDFLSACVRYGVSVCFAGATGSGKTALMGWLLTTIPDNLRLLTIEEGSRELNLVKHDADGNVINSVVHMLCRPNEKDSLNIDQDYLLTQVLRKHPNIIGMGEIRGKECMAVAEAARTGHTVTTTIHSNSAKETYGRMVTLAQRKFSMADSVLLKIMAEAFPVIVYTKQLEDGSRHIMEIFEGERVEGTEIIGRSLYQYAIRENVKTSDGKTRIVGEHVHTSAISHTLRQRLLNNGISNELLQPFCSEDFCKT